MTIEEIEKSKDLLKVYGFTKIEGADTLNRVLPIFKKLPEQTQVIRATFYETVVANNCTVRLREFETRDNSLISTLKCSDITFRDFVELEKFLVKRKEDEIYCEKYYS